MNHIFPLMQPILTKQPPASSNWVHQIKYDGIRLLCIRQSDGLELLTRKQKQRTIQYPELTQIVNQVHANSYILDGEAIVRSKTGKPQFSLAVRRDRSSTREKIAQLMRELPIEYQVFDILMKDGEDLRNHSLQERLTILQQIIEPNQWLHLVENHSKGQELFIQMAKIGWEGVVSKDLRSPYLLGKTHQHWYKTKVKQQLLSVVGGVQYNNGFPNSLLLGAYQGDQLRFIGKISSGLTSQDLQLLHTFVPNLELSESPFSNPPVQSLPIKWIKPQLTLLAEYTELTDEGLLRQPKILGFTQSAPEKARWNR